MELSHILLLVSLNIVYVLGSANDFLLVTDLSNSTIWTGPMDTLDLVAIPLENVITPVAIDYDPVEQKMYWTDVTRKTISRAFLTGESQEVVLSFLGVPDGLTIDVENRYLYWTDVERDIIERANLDGSERVVILHEDHDQPRAILVDSAGGHLYWTDWGDHPKIERAKVNGSERVTLVDTDLRLPNGIAIDYEDQRLYWCDAGLDTIETTDLNGGTRRRIAYVEKPNIHPFDIGIYNNDIYWSDWRISKLVRIDKYHAVKLYAVGSDVLHGRAGGLHIYQEHDGSCTSNPCRNGGRCRQLTNGYQCVCQPGFDGERCDNDVDECSSDPCLNGGECVNEIGRYTCYCSLTGWHGIRCETGIDECSSNPCLHGGRCVDEIGRYTCDCGTTGWNGDRCETDLNECAQTPDVCDVNADCTNTIGGYKCVCGAGFTWDGNSCSDVDECSSDPCLNGGECVNGIGRYMCHCSLTGWYGNRCETDIDECSSNPCLHGGRCVNEIGRYTCDCGTTGWNGIRCETDLNECAQTPDVCDVNADCTNTIGSYKCVCGAGFTWDGNSCSDSEDFESAAGFESNAGIPSWFILGGTFAGAIILLILVVIIACVCKRNGTSPNRLDALEMRNINTEHPPKKSLSSQHMKSQQFDNPTETSDINDGYEMVPVYLPGLYSGSGYESHITTQLVNDDGYRHLIP